MEAAPGLSILAPGGTILRGYAGGICSLLSPHTFLVPSGLLAYSLGAREVQLAS